MRAAIERSGQGYLSIGLSLLERLASALDTSIFFLMWRTGGMDGTHPFAGCTAVVRTIVATAAIYCRAKQVR